VSYVVATSHQGSPVAENFAATAFPPTAWTSVNPNGGANWSRAAAEAYNFAGSGSAKYDFFNNTVVGDVDELFLPPDQPGR
jgi:hypothetical protein